MVNDTISFTSIGDCCVDVYPDHDKVFLGGTAFNTAFHAKKAGAKASIISAVGTDKYGKKFLSQAPTYGIDTLHIVQRRGVTSSVQIPLDTEGKPMFAGWDLGVLRNFRLSESDAKFLTTQDIVKITYLKPLQKLFDSFYNVIPNLFRDPVEMLNSTRDYLAQARGAVQHDGKKRLIICDFAGGSQYSIDVSDIEQYISLFDICIRSVAFEDKKELAFLKQLAQQYKTIIVASLGSHGSMVFQQGAEYMYPAVRTDVTDTTGAGDAYIALFAFVYFQTRDIPQAMAAATTAAAETITHFGANA